MSLAISRVSLGDLVADPANARKHDERNLAAIRASLREHGQVEPLVVQRSSRVVIGGNGRVAAMRAEGWTEADVVYLDIDDTTARKLSIRLNRTAELAEWDEGVLSRTLIDLAKADETLDLGGLGFSADDFRDLVLRFAPNDEIASKLVQFETGKEKGATFKPHDETTFAHTCPRCGFGFDDKAKT
jgi:hypothetical protein